MTRLVVKLPPDRNYCGTLTLYNARGRRICGPFAVAGRSSDAHAIANGNPSRNALFRFGDTPTGDYEVRDILKSGKGTPFEASEFGSNAVVVLVGVLGDAALAEANGRFHVLIGGGKLTAAGELRSTMGSLRLSDQDQQVLLAALRKLDNVRCMIEEDVSTKSRRRVYADPQCEYDDPQNLHMSRERTATRSINRELLLGGAAGAMMLEVAFVSLPAMPAHASEAPVQQNAQNMRDDVRFLPPIVDSGQLYVRLAYGGQALEQLQNAQHQTTGQTFDNSHNPQPSDATPNGSANVSNVTPSVSTGPAPNAPTVAPPSQPNTGGPSVEQVIQQQRQINAIQSEKALPNATQEQLNQQQQNQQQRIQNVTNPPAEPSTPTPPAKTNSVVLDRGAVPPPPKPSTPSDSNNGSSQ
jgi:hypothetical protein